MDRLELSAHSTRPLARNGVDRSPAPVVPELNVGETADIGLGVRFGSTPPSLTVAGEIDMLTAPFVSAALAGLGNRTPTFVVDVSRVTFIDTRGARALASAGARARRAGGRVIVRGASPFVARVLELTRATQLVELERAGAAGSRVGVTRADSGGVRGLPGR